MARIAEPIIIHKRGNSFQFTLNSTCGLPRRVCAEWQRRSFKTLPDELFPYRNPKTKPEAKANIQVLIAFLKKKLEAGLSARRPVSKDITVGNWLRQRRGERSLGTIISIRRPVRQRWALSMLRLPGKIQLIPPTPEIS